MIIIITVISSVLGIPDVHQVFTSEIVNFVETNPTANTVQLVSFAKLALSINAIGWLIALLGNIKLTLQTKTESQFIKYLQRLIITGTITFICSILLRVYLMW